MRVSSLHKPFRLLPLLYIWHALSLQQSTLFTRKISDRVSSTNDQVPRIFHLQLQAGSKKNLSSSERERREEERRKNERKDDVVIGKTSAKRGETDYALDPKSTEQEYLKQLSNVEKEIFYRTEQGLELLKSLKLEEAEKEFDKVFELRPNAYLWQAGIVKYYLGRMEEAGEMFARSARLYESKFGQPASEERIWRDACELKLLNALSKRGRKELEEKGEIQSLITRIPDFKSDDILCTETRKPIKLSRDLFGASIFSDTSNEILARAKLRSLCGKKETTTPDRKMWKLNAWFYLGLHYDALGDLEESKNCMKMALKLCPSSGKSDDIIHTLPMLHMSVRDWFDDSDFEDDPMTEKLNAKEQSFSPRKSEIESYASADPFIEESIRDGVEKMRHHELKSALKLRGLKTVGSKQELQERLFFSLMDDAGFQSGFAP